MTKSKGGDHSMYGKAFCVLIIVLILIYNLATGSAETVASSNTDPVVMATYAAWVQAVAAVITLAIMVWLGIRQNKLATEQQRFAKQQANFAFYEKRFKIYYDLLELINRSIALQPVYETGKDNPSLSVVTEEYCRPVREWQFQMKVILERIPFLFEKEFSIEICEIIEREETEIEKLKKFYIDDMCERYGNDNHSVQGYHKIKEQLEKVREIRQVLIDKFKEYLKFDNL